MSAYRDSPTSLAWRRFRRQKAAMASLIVLSVLCLAALFAPVVEALLGIDAESVNLMARYGPPSLDHPLGTDELGRDVLARLLHGGRVSLAAGFATAGLAAVIGTVVGLIAGYRGGLADAALMRLTDGVMALPLLPLLIVLAAIDPAKLGLSYETTGEAWFGVARIVVIIAVIGWTTVARLCRAATLSIRSHDFVRAATALGAGPGHIMARHILPNVTSPIIVATTLSVGNIILLESGLSFLGLGIQPPLPSWGNMLTGALDNVWSAPLLALWPGLFILVTVLCFNLLGDGLQQALNPKSQRPT